MASLTHFDTWDVDPANRLEQWGAFITGAPGRVQIEALDGAPFHGRITLGDFGAMRLFHIVAGPHRLRSGPGHPSHRPLIRIVVQRRGTALFAQGGHELALDPGCWTVWPVSRPHIVTNRTEVEQLCLIMPQASLGLSEGALLRWGGGRLGDRPGIARMVPEHILQLFEQLGSIDRSAEAEMTDIVAHLIRLALGETEAMPREQMRETLRARVIAHVRHNLRDPGLKLDRIAGKFGCSKRYLHQVFSDTGVTLSQFIWAERLVRSGEALRSADLADRSITEIAFMWGFNNSTHFSKAFKARYGMTPGQWRVQGGCRPPFVAQPEPLVQRSAATGPSFPPGQPVPAI